MWLNVQFDQDLMSEKSQIDNQNKIEIDVETINKKKQFTNERYYRYIIYCFGKHIQ